MFDFGHRQCQSRTPRSIKFEENRDGLGRNPIEVPIGHLASESESESATVSRPSDVRAVTRDHHPTRTSKTSSPREYRAREACTRVNTISTGRIRLISTQEKKNRTNARHAHGQKRKAVNCVDQLVKRLTSPSATRQASITI